jgi:hypothetical protein
VRLLFILGCIGTLFSCQPDLPPEVSEAMQLLPPELDYNYHVKPILSDKCFACHGPDQKKQKAGLRLDLAENAYGELPENPGKVAIDPGSLRNSEVVRRILSTEPEVMMPSPESHLTLSPYEKAVLVRWIKEGAEYKPHWAFVPPQSPVMPEVQNKKFVRNPIDRFILHKLEEKKLAPSREADRETLIRRVTLDLTGLPPTIAQIDSFLRDKRPNAYEILVDSLLASPHYGERMAVDWLDLARFADSHGYTVDRLRDMTPYRDWVIKSFNKNMPYDTFIHWQLAGDLLPDPETGGAASRDMQIATAFNRNHQQNMEGGIIEKEFQTEYVLDRTNTFGEAFLGLSVGCARCHDHKYDPVSQKNYYQLSSFFNNIEEAGQISWDNSMPSPTLLLPDERQEKTLDSLQKLVDEQLAQLREEQAKALADFETWLSKKGYAKLREEEVPAAGLRAKFSFDKSSLRNELNQKEVAYTTLVGDKREKEEFVAGHRGEGLRLNGDAWLDLDRIGIFRKSEPFSVGLWVNIPKEVKEGVIFHKSQAERLYNFKGYHLYLKEGKLEASMAYAAPSNAITKLSRQNIPRDQWVQLTMTYDGSGKAAGLTVYLNGAKMAMDTRMDQLSKDIIFEERYVKPQPGLQIGGWYRGYGIKNGLVDDILVYNRCLTPYEVAVAAGKASWSTIATRAPSALTPREKGLLQAFYLSAEHAPSAKVRKLLIKQKNVLADSVNKVPELMVMQETPRPKQAYLLDRGNYNAPGEKVYPSTPEKIFPFPAQLPKNRVGLARWLTDKRNPLTARVAANRYWQLFFGTGLVKTTEDFGNQGELPSHPELLDWLALHFQESGWDVKQLVRTLVTSATYRQESRPRKELLEKDPQNRLLARGPARRLSAEMMRDNALMASGLINLKLGGKSIKPYQPADLWRINSSRYEPDSGDIIYKRSLYVLVKRSVPNPTLSTLDAPSRSFCTVRRQKTSSPLQALVTLNDPTYVEAANVLGEKMAQNEDPEAAITLTYRSLTGRTPPAKELNLLMQMQAGELARFRQDPKKAKGWLSVGQYRVSKSLDAPTVASYAVVASTIMNSDATLIRR